MEQREGYDVLRLIEHGSICYVSSEYITGMSLIYWLKEHPEITKEEFYGWIQSLIKQLILIHRCRGNPGYRYVNPYCILVAENRTLHYLDMDAKSNADLAKQMQSRNIREHFLPPDYQNYRITKEKIDIYGLGKTIQYILSAVMIESGLSRKEESKFQKIISKCLKQHTKRSFQRISDIQKYIPKYERKRKLNILQKKYLLILLVFLVLAVGVGKYYPERQKFVDNKEKSQAEAGKEAEEKDPEIKEPETGVTEKESVKGKNTGYKELALIYFLELGKPELALESLEKEKRNDEVGEEIKLLIQMFERPDDLKVDELRTQLKNLENDMPEEGKKYYEWFLVKGYDFIKTYEPEKMDSRDGDALIQIGKEYLELSDETDKGREEVLESMAGIYEDMEQIEEAAQIYGQLLEMCPEVQKTEMIYKKLILMYEENDRPDQALESCVKGVETCPESVELKNLHIRLLCSESEVGREICSQTIAEYLKESPELKDDNEFKKLQKEYGIKVEGEKVWIEE